MKWIRSAKFQFLLVILCAFVLRLVIGFWWQSRLSERFAFGDSDSYWVLAETILAGNTYQYHTADAQIFRTPGYPMLLAGWFSLWGSDPPIWWGRVLSAILGSCAVVIVGGFAWSVATSTSFTPINSITNINVANKKVTNRNTLNRQAAICGIFAAIIAALHPEAIGLGVFILSEVPFCPLLMLQLFLFYQLQRFAKEKSNNSKCIALGILTGILAGLATLCRPSWLLFTPLLACVWFVTDRNIKTLAYGSLMIVALCMVMSPWWYRNAQLTGTFIPTTLQVGASLYDGLNPQATGASEMSFVPEFKQELRQEWEERNQSKKNKSGIAFEMELNQRMQQAAIHWAKEHPQRVIELALIKFGRMWNIWPNEVKFRSWPLRIAVMTAYLFVMGFACYGSYLVWRSHSEQRFLVILLWLPAIYYSLLHMIFVGSIRYRQPILFPLMILSAIGCCQLWYRKKSA